MWTTRTAPATTATGCALVRLPLCKLSACCWATDGRAARQQAGAMGYREVISSVHVHPHEGVNTMCPQA